MTIVRAWAATSRYRPACGLQECGNSLSASNGGHVSGPGFARLVDDTEGVGHALVEEGREMLVADARAAKVVHGNAQARHRRGAREVERRESGECPTRRVAGQAHAQWLMRKRARGRKELDEPQQSCANGQVRLCASRVIQEFASDALWLRLRTCQKPRWTMMLPRRVTGHGHIVTTTCVVSMSAAAICHDAVPRKEMYKSASPDGCGRDVQSQLSRKARRPFAPVPGASTRAARAYRCRHPTCSQRPENSNLHETPST